MRLTSPSVRWKWYISEEPIQKLNRILRFFPPSAVWWLNLFVTSWYRNRQCESQDHSITGKKKNQISVRTFVTVVPIISSGTLAACSVFGQKTPGAVSAMLHTADSYTVEPWFQHFAKLQHMEHYFDRSGHAYPQHGGTWSPGGARGPRLAALKDEHFYLCEVLTYFFTFQLRYISWPAQTFSSAFLRWRSNNAHLNFISPSSRLGSLLQWFAVK